MSRISKLRFKPPSQIGLKGIQPPPEKGMLLNMQLTPGYGYAAMAPSPEIWTVGHLIRHQLELAQVLAYKLELEFL